MFLKAAASVYEALSRRVDELRSNPHPDCQEQDELDDAVSRLAGAGEVITVLNKLHNLLLDEKVKQAGISFPWGKDVHLIVGRQVLIRMINDLRKRVTNQKKELRRLNATNRAIAAKLRWDLQTVKEAESRWVTLSETSPSGKQLWLCRVCGRVSPTPDKRCASIADPHESFGCSKYPNHPNKMSDRARMVAAIHYIEESFDGGNEPHPSVMNAYEALTGNTDTKRWRTVGAPTRALAGILREMLQDLSKAPQKRNQQISELIEFCQNVEKGLVDEEHKCVTS